MSIRLVAVTIKVVPSPWKLGKVMTLLDSWVGDYSMKRVRDYGWRERSKRGP
jgi:hypothetical protein